LSINGGVSRQDRKKAGGGRRGKNSPNYRSSFIQEKEKSVRNLEGKSNERRGGESKGWEKESSLKDLLEETCRSQEGEMGRDLFSKRNSLNVSTGLKEGNEERTDARIRGANAWKKDMDGVRGSLLRKNYICSNESISQGDIEEANKNRTLSESAGEKKKKVELHSEKGVVG